MQRIQDAWLEIKTWADEALASWGLILLIILAILAAFGLGRLSVVVEAKPLVSISNAAAAAVSEPMDLGGYVVASWSGAVYYFPWCAGAGQIAEGKKQGVKKQERGGG